MKGRIWSVSNKKYHDIGKLFRLKSETKLIVGPFKVNKKKYFLITYFIGVKYWGWFINNFPRVLLSRIKPNVILKIPFITERITGVLIINDKGDVIKNNEIINKVSKIGLVFIEAYLNPVFTIKHEKVFNLEIKLHNRLYDDCKNRKLPQPSGLAEKIYFEKLREADKQVVDYHSLYLNYNKRGMRIMNLFYDISDNPTGKNIDSLRRNLLSIYKLIEKNNEWLIRRASTWTDFVDSHNIYLKSKQENISINRVTKIVVIEVLIELIGRILSLASVIFSIISNIFLIFWSRLFNYIFGFKWQKTMLLRSVEMNNAYLKRIKQFIQIYQIPETDELIRNF